MFRGTLAWLLPAGLIALSSAAFLNLTRGYALLGWDAYPIVLTSRIDSLAGFFETFGDRLMDGRYPGVFYRPLFELTIALDHALWDISGKAAKDELQEILKEVTGSQGVSHSPMAGA